MKTTDRERAIDWFNKQPPPKRQNLCREYYTHTQYKTLRGGEIEHIWRAKENNR